MVKRSIFSAAIALCAAMGLCVPAAAEGNANFSVDGVNYTVSLPQEFCLPQDETQNNIAVNLAALDTMNDTKLHVFHCERGTSEYMLLKIQRQRIPIGLPKDQFLSLLSTQFQTQFGQDIMDQETRDAEQMIADGTDDQITMKDSTMDYGGVDGDCVYLIGSSIVEDPVGVTTVRSASCITLIGNYSFAFHSYGRAEDGVTYDTLKGRSKSFATGTRLSTD